MDIIGRAEPSDRPGVHGQVKATRIFQARAVTQNGYSDWSDSMTRVVM